MSVIRAYPRVGDYKEPFVKVVVAFLEQVLHIDAATVSDISFEQPYTSEFLSPYFPSSQSMREWAVTVRLFSPSEHLGDTVYLGMKYSAGEYSISAMAFEPGWKPAREQATVAEVRE